jgi:aldehyde dehydrogenase (NAD+)
MTPGKRNTVVREPVGVVGIISPWNYPFNLSMRALAPAIALGNTVVLKPDENTPITGGLAIARLFEEAGLPDGVVNVVPGHGSEIGDHFSSHPTPSVMSFTGSTEIGRRVAKRAAHQLHLPILELGGNCPNIVLEDADLERTIDASVTGSFINQGQGCISINRHLVHESVYDEYVSALSERAEQLTIGHPLDEGVEIGPIINESQHSKIVDYVERSIEQGAKLEAGGGHDDLFFEPTVLSNVSNDMPTACNEHFGPIAPVIPFKSTEQAIEMANNTQYGLAAAIHSKDIGKARKVAEEIDAGMVHINDHAAQDEPHLPFGGMKSSGLGRYNDQWIMNELTEPKWISVQDSVPDYPL